jgi:hypothetical protein
MMPSSSTPITFEHRAELDAIRQLLASERSAIEQKWQDFQRFASDMQARWLKTLDSA